MGQASMARIRSPRRLNAPAQAVFVPIGIVTVLLGPLLPILSSRWSLNYVQAGSLFTAQFLGSTAGVLISGFFVARRGCRFAINAGLLGMALGVGALAFSGHWWGLICIVGYGLGLGLAIPAVNLFVAAANPERRSAALSLLNFCWSVGAVACPFIVAVSVKVDRIGLFLLLLAGFLFLMFLAVAGMPLSFGEPSLITGEVGETGGQVPRNWNALFGLGALFFLYVGAENAFGGWIASYAESLGKSPSSLPVMTPSFFYAALMLGRWIAPFALQRIGEIFMARAGLFAACLGIGATLLSRTVPLVAISVSLAGLGLAAVYPITISRLSHEFGRGAARVGSIMFTLANCGGASLPWVVGYFSHRFGDLRAGLAVPLASGAVMFALYQRQGEKAQRLAP